MKKYFLLAFSSVLIIFPQFASAQRTECAPGDKYSYVTGAQCSTSTIRGCTASTAFSPLTGESCAHGVPGLEGSMIVMSPNGGEVRNQDIEQRVSWLYGFYGGIGMTGNEKATVSAVFPDGSICEIGETLVNIGWFNFTPKNVMCLNDTSKNLRSGGQFKIRLLVRDTAGTQVANDDSNASFTILGLTVHSGSKFWIDSVSLKDQFKSNEPISFSNLVGKEADGTFARREEGFNVQWSVLTTRIPAIGESIYGQSFNADYDSLHSVWYASANSTTLPPGEYSFHAGLYCGLIKSACTDKYGSEVASLDKNITVTQ
ncbi:MAG: hypothetical protein PHV93_04115 [Candidatus Pacebacteria bacterium]|nr:hypothetical protein [Candidatus Paceibacterota bacterium]